MPKRTHTQHTNGGKYKLPAKIINNKTKVKANKGQVQKPLVTIGIQI